MIEIAELKQSVDLLDLVGRDTNLRRHARTRGGEWVGPCPMCQSGHRIHVQPVTGLFMCRACHPQWGDCIEYAIWTEKAPNFREACDWLASEYNLTQGGSGRMPREPLPPAVPPSWQSRGRQIVDECATELFGPLGKIALDTMHRRGLADETLREFRIGWCWQEAQRYGLHVPRGWTIPTLAVDGQLWGIKIRRDTRDPSRRYTSVVGSSPALVGRLTGKPILLLAEGDLDCALAWQEVGDLVDVASLGSCDASPEPWLCYLLGYERLLIAYDVDQAGESAAAKKWGWLPRAERVWLPLRDGQGKDMTDYVKAGGNLRAWLQSVLSRELQDPPQCVDCEDRAACPDRLRIMAAWRAA